MSMRVVLALTFIAGCNSNLKVKVSTSAETLPESKSLSLLVADTVSNDPAYKVSWEAGEEIDSTLGFSFHISQEATCEDPIFSFEGVKENAKQLDFLKDGKYFLCLYGKTKAGATVAANNNGLEVTLDRTPPLVSVSSQLTLNQTTIIEASITDFLATAVTWQKLAGPGDVVFSDPSLPSPSVSMTADGVYELLLTVKDLADNHTEKKITVTWETVPVFTSLVRANEASDGYINSSETAAAGAAFTLTASRYASAQYTGFLDETPAQSCDVNQTYGLTAIPAISAIPATDKQYVICVKLTGTDGSVIYGKSQVITRDVAPPTVDVGSDVAFNASTTINATTSDGTTYAWTKQSGTGTVTFGTPNAEDTTVSASADDVYVLRLTVTDAAGNSAYDEVTMTWDATAPVATISGTPSPSTNDAETLGVTVSGTDVVYYRYKVGLAASTNCADSTGYVAETAVGTAITASIAALDDGALKLCVVGRDTIGNWQTLATATSATWTKAAKVYAATDVTMGEAFSCVLLANGRVKCWGRGGNGRLGTGSTSALGSLATHMGNNLPYVSLGTGKKAIKIRTGNGHGCAILQDQSLKCWGLNSNGQLGLGDMSNRGDGPNEMGDNLPTVDVGTGRKVLDVAGGLAHTCAILDDHTVKCWGKNDYGQLGQGHTNSLGDGAGEMGDNLPVVNLGTNKKARAIYASRDGSCALLDDHSIKCWGDNSYHRLGLANDTNHRGDAPGEMGDSLPAVNLGTGRYALQLSTGEYHACALLDTHQIKCWGSGFDGRLGYGSGTHVDATMLGDTHATVALGTGRSVMAVAAGQEHTCALLDDSSVKCWGKNVNGALGLGHLNNIGDDAGEMGDSLAAVDLGTGRFATKIFVSNNFTCAVLDNSKVKCWGKGEYGRLGQGSVSDLGDSAGEMGDALADINLVTGGSRAVLNVATRGDSACAILDDHTLKCWGQNTYGQLGLGDTVNRGTLSSQIGANLPTVNVGTGRKVLQVAIGSKHTCAVLDDRTVKCWGNNDGGQLGLGDVVLRGDGPNEMGDNLPIVDLDGKAVELGAGFDSTCARLVGSTIKCWGLNYHGMLGIGDNVARGDTAGQMGSSLPAVDLGTGMKAVRLASGWLSHCAILQDSTMKCWGRNDLGQLGYGDTTDRGTSSAHMGDNLLAVSMGANRHVIDMPHFYYTPCVKLDDGSVKCWGRNAYGALGDASTTSSSTPIALDIGSSVRTLAPGLNTSAAIDISATVKGWGQNSNGKLGYGLGGGANIGDEVNEMGVATPTINLGNGRFAVQLAAGNSHFCSLTDLALVKCWGTNANGELALGDTATRGDDDFEMGDYLPFGSLW